MPGQGLSSTGPGGAFQKRDIAFASFDLASHDSRLRESCGVSRA